MARQSVLHSVGRVDDFAIGKFRIFNIEERSIGVVNTGEAFYAVLNVCPHALAPVCEGVITGTPLPGPPGEEPVFGLRNRILRCPWHLYEFDLASGGRAVFTDFTARVRVFPVIVETGEVFVELTVRPYAKSANANTLDDRPTAATAETTAEVT
jgi:nitrite reductase (NADH) small subunit